MLEKLPQKCPHVGKNMMKENVVKCSTTFCALVPLCTGGLRMFDGLGQK